MNSDEEDKPIEGAQPGEKQVLSKAQKKKLKEKEKAAAAKTDDKPEEDAKEESKGGAGKKGKKAAPRTAIAKLAQARIQEKQEEEERIRIEEDKIKKEEEEIERKLLEEERLVREAKEAKAKDKKDKIDDLKSKGLWKSKKEKIQDAERKRIREQFEAQGLYKHEDEVVDDGKKKSNMVKNKKKPKKVVVVADQQTEDNQDQEDGEEDKEEESFKQSKGQVVAEEAKEEEVDVADNWDEEDVDVLVGKVQAKQTEAQKGGEEDQEEIHISASNQKVVAKPSLKKKEEEKGDAGNDVFSKGGAGGEDSRAQRIKVLKAKREAQRLALVTKKSMEFRFRCPIICILGHVDTGKTLILDKLRRTNVQAGEAGGITQQIGATYFPHEALQEHLERCRGKIDIELLIPGFQIIDTPGHESFTNLRSRGSNLCDIAILVVDLMHGLEKQTLESLQLIRNKKTPFVVALNKIDRCYDWKMVPFNNVRDALDQQPSHTQAEFNDRLKKIKLEFAEQGFNSELYWENEDPSSYISLVPTSAITGEGLPDLMIFISQMCQTMFKQKLREKEEFECTVLEVKVIEGLGTTIDVILVNGILKVGDTIVISGFNGPIVTTIRALLTPQPMKEMRVKGEYIHHQQIQGSMGIKISAPLLENALAGSELFKASNEEEIKTYKAQIEDDLVDILDKYVDKTKHGVCVQASTLGSLEALLEFLKTMKIPVTNINIGPLHRKDILKAMKSLTGESTRKEFATILAFDVKVTPEAQEFADENGIKVFTANIIYHLFDQFEEYVKKCREERQRDEGVKAVFPCLLEMVKGAMFHNKDPIVIGVSVKAGILKVGTPLCIPEKGKLKIGHVDSIELNSKPVQSAKPIHGNVAIKISGESQVMYGRHFDDTNQIVSILSRDSIDALKTYYKDDLDKEDWKLVIQLKRMFEIP